MPRVLLLSTTTGYQTRMFGRAAERLGVELRFGTDRCHALDDPWRDAAVAIRFHAEADSVRAIVAAAVERPVDGVLALGDRPTVIAALAARALGLPGHPAGAARAASNKLLTRRRLAAARLPGPWFFDVPLDSSATAALRRVGFPCVIKPLALSGSRGVIRANDPDEFCAAFERVRRLLRQVDVRAMRDPANDVILVEAFIEGREFALEGVLEHGTLQGLALFDKPDPLDGPFFEETIYVTPSMLPPSDQARVARAVGEAAAALGLYHGPIHAECRLNDQGVYVLEVAARPIGGLCARVLRFVGNRDGLQPLEELLLRHALGESVRAYPRESAAAGVMMIPISREGTYRRVEGLESATAVPGVEAVRITAKPDQRIVPLPEGASYLGFIFARAASPAEVVEALRAAHRRLHVVIETPVPVV